MPEDTTTVEAIRIINICNACRYCEGHCAVFPAMERETVFNVNDIGFLASLCHQCGACYRHCQYSDPHEFNVNVPATLAQARLDSYEKFAWPGFMQRTIRSGSAFPAISLLVSITLFLIAVGLQVGPSGLIEPHYSFYELMPHAFMAGIFAFAALVVVVTWWKTLSGFWRSVALPRVSSIRLKTYQKAFADALLLRNLDGGHGDGCYEASEQPSLLKKRYHHLTLTGFMLCFAATLTGTIYHYGLSAPAPYDWLSLPKLFGVVGGTMLLIGCSGLMWIRKVSDTRLTENDRGYGQSLTVLLFLTSLTGMALPVAKGSSLLGILLAVHLGCVLALFINFAWGKFTHGFFRLISLLADEQQKISKAPGS